MPSQISQNFHFHEDIHNCGKKSPYIKYIAYADFGTVAYGITSAKHVPHEMRHAAGCFKQYATLYKMIGGKRIELVRFHSYHVAAYFWNVLNGKIVNYPLYLLRGFSINCATGAKDIATMARISHDYVAELFSKIEHTYGIVAEAIPVPEGFPLYQKAVLLGGFHRDLGYFAGPAVAVPLHGSELDQYVAVYLASTAAAFAKAQQLSRFSYETGVRAKAKKGYRPTVLIDQYQRKKIAPYLALPFHPAQSHRIQKKMQLRKERSELQARNENSASEPGGQSHE